ncbi:MAG: response regulator transcription factor [Patescibacteria group bacterium]
MRALLVEDEKEITEFLKSALEEECFAVDVADDGEKGSFLATTSDYDIIILDLNMPKRHGIQICKDVRESGKNTPIIILSVQSEVPTKVELLDAGADDFLTKPFSFDELLGRIKAILRRPSKLEGEVLRTGDLILDLKKQTAKRGDRHIYLTRKEFAFLEYLIRNKGSVVSRAMIMEHVWDMNADPFSNTIESHVMNLRKKIDSGNKNKLIQTISGRGYKIS